MAITIEEEKRWIEMAKIQGAAYIISVCDTFSYEDYPVYIMPDENLENRKKSYDNNNMQRINKVITIEYKSPKLNDTQKLKNKFLDLKSELEKEGEALLKLGRKEKKEIEKARLEVEGNTRLRIAKDINKIINKI